MKYGCSHDTEFTQEQGKQEVQLESMSLHAGRSNEMHRNVKKNPQPSLKLVLGEEGLPVNTQAEGMFSVFCLFIFL
jgi:hypothetical protein